MGHRVGTQVCVKLYTTNACSRDLSFLAQQYCRFGAVSNSMMAVLLFHTIYVVDFFINEEW